MLKSLLAGVGILALAFTAPSNAETSDAPASEAIAQFVPHPTGRTTRFDFSHWDQALDFFVLELGPSLRENAFRPDADVGSRLVYGHTSRYRLEGNRVVFSMLEPEVIETLTEYRKDLEHIGNTVDIGSMPRNEQLAFWINLHNVAMVEQIARAYPVRQPRSIKIDGRSLDEAPILTIRGVALSPRDIRTRIVYPNWKEPNVIYGFFRGEIGGPSLQSNAFNGENVGALLELSANEFVNSLRGVQSSGDTLLVSEIYEEARPFFFADWPESLREHIRHHADDDAQSILAKTGPVNASIYEHDIADLAGGERTPIYSNVESCGGAGGGQTGMGDCSPISSRIPQNVLRFVQERSAKVNALIKRGRLGRVIIGQTDAEGNPVEVE